MAWAVGAAESEDDRAQVRRLLEAGFSEPRGLGRVLSRLYDGLSGPDAQSLVYKVDGKVAGHVLTVFRPFCLQAAHLPGAILTMVVVDPAHRRRGLGSELVRAAEACAADRGVVFAHLSGDPTFYGRLGYVQGYRRAECRLPVADLPAGAGPACRPALPSDAPSMSALAVRQAPAGSVAPTAGRFRWLAASGHPFDLLACQPGFLGFRAERDLRLAVVDGHSVTGYLMGAVGDATLGVYEAVGGAACPPDRLLAAAACAARENGCRHLTLSLSASHPLVAACERGGGRAARGVDTRLLARVLDVEAAASALVPVLSGRLRAAPEGPRAGSVGFSVAGSSFLLEVSGRDLSFHPGRSAPEGAWQVSLPGIGFTRAVLGTEGLARLAGSRLRGEPELRRILEVLFPRLEPHFHLADSL